MKKVFLFAVFALVLGLTTKVFAASLVDVPSGHWAEDAVQKLVDMGCIEGYPDGTYKGDRPMTRYEYAMVVKRCMDYVDKTYCTPDNGKCKGGTAEQVDLSEIKATIQKLASEFKDELAALKVQVDEQGNEIKEIKKRLDQPMVGKLTVGGSIRQRIDLPESDLSFTTPTLTQPTFGSFYQAHYNAAAAGTPTDLKAGYEIYPVLTFNGNVKPNASLSIELGNHISNQSGIADYSPTPTQLDINHAYVALDFTQDVKELDLLKVTSGYQAITLGPLGLLLDNSGLVSNPAIRLDLAKGIVSVNAVGALGSVTGGNTTGLGASVYDAVIAGRLGIDLTRVKLGFNWLGSGIGKEKGWSGDVVAKLLDSPFLPALRGEYLTITDSYNGLAWPTAFGTTAAKDYAYVLGVDVYKTKRTGFTFSYADAPAVPGLSGLDQNPFTEFDATCALGNDYPNSIAGQTRGCTSKAFESGRVLFPGGFKGFGVEASYKVLGDVTLKGKAVVGDYAGGSYLSPLGVATALRGTKYPGYAGISVSKPINNDTIFSVEYMQQGKNPVLLNRVRGELLINF